MALFYQPEIRSGAHFLEIEESKHCIKVLRMKVGDTFHLTDGKGYMFKVEITDANHKKVAFKILDQKELTFLNDFHLEIIVAPTKNLDRLEWFVEKATEIGLHQLSFVICKHSERKILKTDRLIKKAVSAMKQSKKATLPYIKEAESFKKWMSDHADEQAEKFIAYVDKGHESHLKNALTAGKKYQILIGPEGDFAPDEIELAFKHGFQPVSLGPSVLRTETAALMATTIANLINQ